MGRGPMRHRMSRRLVPRLPGRRRPGPVMDWVLVVALVVAVVILSRFVLRDEDDE